MTNPRTRVRASDGRGAWREPQLSGKTPQNCWRTMVPGSSQPWRSLRGHCSGHSGPRVSFRADLFAIRNQRVQSTEASTPRDVTDHGAGLGACGCLRFAVRSEFGREPQPQPPRRRTSVAFRTKPLSHSSLFCSHLTCMCELCVAAVALLSFLRYFVRVTLCVTSILRFR